VSASAEAFRAVVAADRADADRAAAELERAAALLAAHADDVRAALAAIARFEDEIRGWFARQERTLDRVVDAVGRVVPGVVGDPPWSGWPIGPHNLPRPGEARWLEVGGFLRSKGVL
jgi:hypothetical protein